MAKNYVLAQEYNESARKYYLEAMAYMKQRVGHDQDALKTLELLAKTHKRKAKLIRMRQTTGVAQVKSKLKDMMDEEKRLKKASQSNQPEVLAQLSEHQKKAISERDRYLDKMKQQLLIINSGTFIEAKIMLEELIKSQKSKLEKFENRFTEIL